MPENQEQHQLYSPEDPRSHSVDTEVQNLSELPIKKNLTLIIVGVIVIILLPFAAYFSLHPILGKKSANQHQTQSLALVPKGADQNYSQAYTEAQKQCSSPALDSVNADLTDSVTDHTDYSFICNDKTIVVEYSDNQLNQTQVLQGANFTALPLAQWNITLDSASKTALQNGGQDFLNQNPSSALSNIQLAMTRSSDPFAWDVTFTGKDQTMDILIDAQSGKVISYSMLLPDTKNATATADTTGLPKGADNSYLAAENLIGYKCTGTQLESFLTSTIGGTMFEIYRFSAGSCGNSNQYLQVSYNQSAGLISYQLDPITITNNIYRPIPLDNWNIPYDQALNTALQNGGQDFLNNNQGSSFKGASLTYRPNEDLRWEFSFTSPNLDLVVVIDPNTGNFLGAPTRQH